MTQGLGGLTSGIGKGIGAFVNFKKKLIETKIELALKDNDFILAKELCEELEKQVKLLRS